MNNTTLVFISFLLLVSCSITNKTQGSLFDSYLLYSESTNEHNIKDIAKSYFSQTLLGSNYKTNTEASGQLLFKNYMNSITDHYEVKSDQSGCLTINGYDKEKSPVLFSLRYKNNNGHWLIDKIHVVLLENIDNFSKEAKCPETYIY